MHSQADPWWPSSWTEILAVCVWEVCLPRWGLMGTEWWHTPAGCSTRMSVATVSTAGSSLEGCCQSGTANTCLACPSLTTLLFSGIGNGIRWPSGWRSSRLSPSEWSTGSRHTNADTLSHCPWAADGCCCCDQRETRGRGIYEEEEDCAAVRQVEVLLCRDLQTVDVAE